MQERNVRNGLSVGDGFRFGCGFILAGVIFNILLFVVLGGIGFVISLLGYALTFPGIG